MLTKIDYLALEWKPDMRVVIVAEHASAQFGGEAFLLLCYFRLLRPRNEIYQQTCRTGGKQVDLESYPIRKRQDLAQLIE